MGCIGIQKVSGVSVDPFVTVALFVLICFTFGLLARFSFVGGMRDWTENSIKSVYPAYDYYKATCNLQLATCHLPLATCHLLLHFTSIRILRSAGK